MNMSWRLPASLVICAAATGCAGTQPGPYVQMETAAGNIVVEIFEDEAPITAENFMRYVDEERFAGARFYRVVTMDNQPDKEIKIEVIQGGLQDDHADQLLSSITHETTRTTSLKHLDGTISMARLEPGTAASEFFICIGNQPELDFGGRRNPDGQGFAAFGRVVEGMQVVREIQQEPSRSQFLNQPVEINRMRRVSFPQ